MAPVFPTLANKSAINYPISLSLLADIVATCLSYSFVVIEVLIFFNSSTIISTALLIPLLKSIGFNPAATALHPSLKIALVRTVAVVVPSPA